MSMNGNLLLSVTLKAVDQMSGIFAKVSGEAKQAENIITRNAAAMRTAGVAMTAAGGAMVGGLVAAATKAAEFGSTLVDMSARTGASVESLSKFGYAAQQTGADMGSVETGLKFVSKNAYAAAQGTGEAADAFNALGISVKDSNGNMKSAEALFLESGNALRNVDDEATRTALSMAIFGRSGTQLIPMFTDAGKSLGEFTADAERLGLVVGTEAANKMDDFGDKLDQLKAQNSKMWAGLGAAAIPVLMQVLDAVQPIIQNITEWIEANPKLAQGVALVVFAAGVLFSTLGPFLILLPTLASGLSIVAGWLGVSGVAGAAATATAATTTLGASMTTLAAAGGPIALVALALAGLVYEVYKLKQAYYEAKDAGEQLINTQKREDQARTEYGRRTGTQGQTAAQQAAINNARPTLGERATGWITPGGVTGQTLARQRVANSQAAPRRANGGPVTPGMGYLVGENEAEMFFPDLPGEIRNQAQTKSLMATYEKFNDMADKATKGRWQDDMFAGFNAKTSSGGNTDKGTQAVNSASQIANILAGAFGGGNAGGSGGGNVSGKVSGIADLISALQGIGGGSGGSGGGGYDCRILIDLAPGLKATLDGASRRAGIEINNTQAARNVSPAY